MVYIKNILKNHLLNKYIIDPLVVLRYYTILSQSQLDSELICYRGYFKSNRM